ncbi:MAG: ABC transporter permease [Thermofilaceae archaeon]|nr:ABC transporter permease [Thermofilaceae archaeon]MCX8180250.1 ABC transporter permease [Thermofilaceae archaeon]MDW8004030.1 ABC transporter permease subunit [Thermofilaceae archaeon]
MIEKVLIITKKEILENIKSVKYWAIVGLFVLLYLSSTYAIGFALRGLGQQGIQRRERVVLTLSSQVANTMSYIAPLIGIALGFGAVAAERDKGTIRLVLARPIYRDALINGKVIAAFILIVLAVLASTLIAVPLAISVQGVNVTLDDFTRLVFVTVPASLLALAYYTMALFVSVNAGRSSQALVVSLSMWIFFSFILPIISSFIAFQILGPPPAMPFNATRPFQPGQGSRQFAEYYGKYSQIVNTIQIMSPNARYTSLINALFALRQSGSYETLTSSLGARWLDVVVLLFYIAAFAIPSYVLFLRRQETR